MSLPRSGDGVFDSLSAELTRDALDASREPLDVWFVHNEHALSPLPPPRDDDNGGDGASHVSSRLACCSYLLS